MTFSLVTTRHLRDGTGASGTMPTREPAPTVVASWGSWTPTWLSSSRSLSLDAGKRDYLRIAGEGPLAKGGAGGDLPEYIGAVPPGPAPLAGDWLSRLREAAMADNLPALAQCARTSGIPVR